MDRLTLFGLFAAIIRVTREEIEKRMDGLLNSKSTSFAEDAAEGW